MAINDWLGRRQAESLRHWPILEALASRAAAIDCIDGLILLGSFARGDPDELSDIDLIARASPGRFREAWGMRHELAGDALVTWESRANRDHQMRWFKWLTREVVKVECGIVDPTSERKELAEPFVVLLGDPSLADAFPRISYETVARRAEAVRKQQEDFDPDEMTDGERIDWKISELKNAVRDALRRERQGAHLV